MKGLRSVAFASALLCSTSGESSAADFSLFGFLDFAKRINYSFIETFIVSELRKLWDNEVGYFLLCTGQHPTSGTENWGIYSREYLEQFACNEDWKVRRLKRIGGILSEIFANPDLSDDEKTFTAAALIEEDASLGGMRHAEPPYFSTGYSVQYGVMRLHFSNMITARDLCPGGEMQTTVTPDSVSIDFVPFVERIYIQPGFRLTKYVDDSPQVLASVAEDMVAVRESTLGMNLILGKIDSFSIRWQDTVNGMYRYLSAEAKARSFPGGHLVFYDFDVDLRPQGSTLRYKLEVFHSGGHRCPPARSWVQELVVDGNGDGQIDFVPKSVYSRLISHLAAFPIDAPPLPFDPTIRVVYALTGSAPNYSGCIIEDIDATLPMIYTQVYSGPNPDGWIAENCGPLHE